MKVLGKEATMRMFELAQNPYRPPEILKLIEEIDGETRAAEVAFSITGILDEERALKIVGMMLKKDHLYALWAEGEIK